MPWEKRSVTDVKNNYCYLHVDGDFFPLCESKITRLPLTLNVVVRIIQCLTIKPLRNGETKFVIKFTSHQHGLLSVTSDNE